MQTIDDAWAALRAGRRREAEVVASQLVDSAHANHGADTPGHATALGELASVLVATGDLPRAVATLRRAAAVNGVDESTTRAQLTHVMNLGELLLALGQTDEAVDVLEAGLAGRRGVYGPGHPGVAYGLQSLADAALAGGHVARASTLVAEAVDIFAHHDHPELASAWVVRAHVRATAEHAPLFDDAELDRADDDQLRALVQATLRRADRSRDPIRTVSVLRAVHDQVLRRFGPMDGAKAGLLTALANLARHVDDHSTRIEALTSLQGLLDALGHLDRAHEVTLGLALATSEAGRPLEAEAHYRDALDRLDRLDPPSGARRSQTLRNYGLWLVETGRAGEAEELLMAASDVEDPILRGQAHAALGITLQHDGQLARAEAELTKALACLGDDNAEALPVLRHLSALREGRACGGTGIEGVGEVLQAIVRDEVPEGLLERLTFDPEGQLQVHLLRQASDDEVAELWRVLRQGLARLRQGMRNRR
ncbi:MAG: tetratricopeptide repeat protein [Myxococcota bacterium]